MNNDSWNKLVEKLHTPEWLKSLVDHNRSLFISLVCVIIGGMFLCSGCDLISTTSPQTGKKINEAQLNIEYSVWQADFKARQDNLATEFQSRGTALNNEAKAMSEKYKVAFSEIDVKKSYGQQLLAGLQTIPAVAGVAGGPWGWLLAIGFGVVSTGLKFDNSRKDRVITAQQVVEASKAGS